MEEYRRWEDNIKMDLKEIGVDVMSCIRYGTDKYVSSRRTLHVGIIETIQQPNKSSDSNED